RRFWIDIQSHVRQFHADVGVHSLCRYFRQQLTVQRGTLHGLVSCSYVLPQVIDGDAQACGVEVLGDADGVVQLGAGDETTGYALPDGRSFSDPPQSAAIGKKDESGSQQGLAAAAASEGSFTIRTRTESCITNLMSRNAPWRLILRIKSDFNQLSSFAFALFPLPG